MKIIRALNILILTMLVVSCSAGKKSLQKGDYYEAVITAVERLRANPDSKRAQQTLKEAYPLGVETLLIEIDNLSKSSDPFKYAGIVDRYEKIGTMAEEIRRSPAARSMKLKLSEYPEQLSAAREKAALESYLAAERLLEKGDRQSAKEAYFLYEAANNYQSNFRDTDEKMDMAMDLATLSVVIENISVPGLYQINADFFRTQITSFLSEKQNDNFVQFIDQEEASRLNSVDHVIILKFDDFVIGSTHDKEVVKELTSKDSVKVGTVTIEGKKHDVYDRVKASYTSHSRQLISSGILDVKVIDALTEKLLANKKFPGEFVWTTEWSSFNGDSRALNSEQLRLSKRKPQLPPPPQDLFLEFTKPIFNQTSSYLYNFYRKY